MGRCSRGSATSTLATVCACTDCLLSPCLLAALLSLVVKLQPPSLLSQMSNSTDDGFTTVKGHSRRKHKNQTNPSPGLESAVPPVYVTHCFMFDGSITHCLLGVMCLQMQVSAGGRAFTQHLFVLFLLVFFFLLCLHIHVFRSLQRRESWRFAAAEQKQAYHLQQKRVTRPFTFQTLTNTTRHHTFRLQTVNQSHLILTRTRPLSFEICLLCANSGAEGSPVQGPYQPKYAPPTRGTACDPTAALLAL
jgi:hypothetical protein